jgi:hypothetical protein
MALAVDIESLLINYYCCPPVLSTNDDPGPAVGDGAPTSTECDPLLRNYGGPGGVVLSAILKKHRLTRLDLVSARARSQWKKRWSRMQLRLFDEFRVTEEEFVERTS